MAKTKPEPTPEEIAERQARYDEYFREQFMKALTYLKLETDMIFDPKIYDLICDGGWEAFGIYIGLALALGRFEGHVFAVEDRETGRDRWPLLASLVGPYATVEDVKATVVLMDRHDLLNRELYAVGRIAIDHISDNAAESADYTAKRRIGGSVGGRGR